MAKKIANKTGNAALQGANVLAAQSVAINAVAIDQPRIKNKSVDLDLLTKKKAAQLDAESQVVVTDDQQTANDVVVDGGDQGGAYQGSDIVLAQAGNTASSASAPASTTAGSGLSGGMIAAGVVGVAAVANGGGSSATAGPAPTYAISRSAATVAEGEAVVFTLTTAHLVAGTKVGYVLSGVSANDVVGGLLTGEFTVGADGKASVTIYLVADALTDGDKILTIKAAGAESTVTVVDASLSNVAIGAVGDNDVAADTVVENSAVGTTVGVTALAIDTDAEDTVSYSLTTNPGNLFAIDEVTGVITVAGQLDYEDPNGHTYTLTVTAKSSDGTLSTQDFTIDVTDAPEDMYLTAGVDTGIAYTGGDGDETFYAVERTDLNGAVVNTWTTGDEIDGGLGNDIFVVTQTAAIAQPLAATVVGVETLNATTANEITLDTTAFLGLTTLNTKSTGGASDSALTAAITTNVTSTLTAQKASTFTIDGGNDVTLTATGSTGGNIIIGGTQAAFGAVAVNSTTSKAGQANITVTGTADTIDITQTLAGGAGGLITTNGGSKVTITQTGDNSPGGFVTVNGGVSTTDVTVTHAGAGVAGAVAIKDAGIAAAAPDTITTVTLAATGNATIDSGALATLNLSGLMGTVDINSNVAAKNQTATTLNINLVGVVDTNPNIIKLDATDASSYTTVNLDASTTASVLDDLAAGTGGAKVTTLNISGDAALTLDNQTALAAAGKIVSTNTVGVTLTTALTSKQGFAGGTGGDKVSLAALHDANVDMGGGDDFLTVVSLAVVPSAITLDGGADGANGDTLDMASADAAAASVDGTFASRVSGFEILSLGQTAAAATDAINIHNLDDIDTITSAGVAATGTLALSGLAGNSTVTFTGAVDDKSSIALQVDTGVADVLNLGYKGSNLGVTTINNVETVNITTTGAGAAAYDLQLDLSGATGTNGAFTVTVSGDTGVDFVAAGNNLAAVTKFDASDVTGTGLGGAVTFTAAAAVGTTITGGSGDDALSGKAAGTLADTITGGIGADTLTGGGGVDTFVYASGDTGITAVTADAITDFTTAVDFIKTGIAGLTADDVTIENGAALANIAAFTARANLAFAAGDDVYVANNYNGTGAAWVAINHDGGATFAAGDSLIVLNAATAGVTDFIA